MRGKGYTEIELKRIVTARREDIRSAQALINQAEENERKGIQFPRTDNKSVIYSSYSYSFKSRIFLIGVLYSLGQKIDDLPPHFSKAVADLDCSYSRDDYSPAHDMWGDYELLLETLSLGILLEADDDCMRKIADAMFYHNVDDALVDFLLSALDIGWQHSTTKYYVPNPYRATRDIIITAQRDKTEASRLMEAYMKRRRRPDDGDWNYEAAALVKILGLDDARLQKNRHYPYELAHYKVEREFIADNYSGWFEATDRKHDGAENIEKEKSLLGAIENDYATMGKEDFYTKYRERFLSDLFSDVSSFQEFCEGHKPDALGFLLVNVLVTDGYILQMDWKDSPEDEMLDFVNGRLETDYGADPIEMTGFENEDGGVDMYDTEYVKTLQKKLKRIGLRLVWFLLDNDQYYTAVVPVKELLGNMWKGIKLKCS